MAAENTGPNHKARRYLRRLIEAHSIETLVCGDGDVGTTIRYLDSGKSDEAEMTNVMRYLDTREAGKQELFNFLIAKEDYKENSDDTCGDFPAIWPVSLFAISTAKKARPCFANSWTS